MAHATTASASAISSSSSSSQSFSYSDFDARIRNLRRNVLPEKPYRLTEAIEPASTRRQGTCKHCGQHKDNCYCHAHHTFLSREEMTTYSDRSSASDGASSSTKPFTPKSTGTPTMNGGGTGTGKKLTLDAYKKFKQEGGGRSTPKDGPSPADPPSQSRDHPTKSKIQSSSSLSVTEPSATNIDSDRPAKKLKTSSSTSVAVRDPAPQKTQISHSAASKDSATAWSPSKKAHHDDSSTHTDRKSTALKAASHKKEVSLSRQRSPPPPPASANERISRGETSRGKRSPSPQERPRPKANSLASRRDDGDAKPKSERSAAKETSKPPRILPKMLSPLPDDLNKLVEEYDRKKIKDRQEADAFAPDEDRPKKPRKPVAERALEKAPSGPESRLTGRMDPDGRSVKPDRKQDRNELSARDSENKESSRVASKVPAKRPPADIIAKQKDTHKEPRLIVRLHYGLRNVGRVRKILRSEVDRSNCEKCRIEWDDDNSPEPVPSKTLPRERSPLTSSRASAALKAPAHLKSSSGSQAATPNRRLPGSERPRPSDTGTSRSSVQYDSDDLGDSEVLKHDSEQFLALGITLKHKADAALGVKNPEDANLNHALVYACHCVIAYFLSFGLEDELRRRDKRYIPSESWRSVVTYIEFLLSSRLKANPAIHGLLYQMGAICSERVSAVEQQRLMSSVSISESSQATDAGQRNPFDSIKRSQRDLVKILQLNHNWWNLGHQRLPWSAVEGDYHKTWSRRSTHVVKKPQIIAGHYLTPFYLPLYSGSTAFEAATFAWMITQEWASEAKLNLDTGLRLTWPRRED